MRKLRTHGDHEAGGVDPAINREDAAARVGMQANDTRPSPIGRGHEAIDLVLSHTELRLTARRAHVLVMAATAARVEAHKDIAPRE